MNLAWASPFNELHKLLLRRMVTSRVRHLIVQWILTLKAMNLRVKIYI